MFKNVVVQGIYNNIVPISYGYEPCCSLHSCGPHIRPFYLIHYIFSGTGVFYHDNKAEEVNKGDIFIIHPNEVTTYTADSTNPWEYAWLSFSTPSPIPFLDEYVIKDAPVGNIFQNIKNMQEGGEDARVFSLVYELLWRLSNAKKQKNLLNYSEYAKTSMDTNFMHHISIENLAASLHIDRHYLCHLFKKNFGISPREYLSNIRLENAKVFLQNGHTVSQSAQLSGFTDISNFSKKFKSKFGNSPTLEKNTKKKSQAL